MPNETIIEYILLGCALLAIFLPILSGRTQLPVLNILARWMRWCLFASIFRLFCAPQNFLYDRIGCTLSQA